MRRVSLVVIGLFALVAAPRRAAAQSCTTASDCTGGLPQECRFCPSGAVACWSWYCISGQCEAAQKCPPLGLGVSIDPTQEWTAGLPNGWELTPDEHSSILPDGTDANGNPQYLVFTTGATALGSIGAVVLRTSDFFYTLTEPPRYSNPVMMSIEDQSCSASGWENVYDNNYAGPGAVFPDPSSPSGTLLMLYEAEDHCRQDASGSWTHVSEYYASVGLAVSMDRGRTWPGPSITAQADRYRAVSLEYPKPADTDTEALGDAIPNGFVNDGYVYAFFNARLPNTSGALIEVARAARDGTLPLTFYKFNNQGQYAGCTGSSCWQEPGNGGIGAPVVPAPANTTCRQPNVVRVDLADRVKPLFLLTMVCQDSSGNGGWYFSTTVSLVAQRWSTPTLIANTNLPITNCTQTGKTDQFDGWYPSFVTPGLRAGRIGASGLVLYANGCLPGPRSFGVRPFQLTYN